jgi:hypothetical protein
MYVVPNSPKLHCRACIGAYGDIGRAENLSLGLNRYGDQLLLVPTATQADEKNHGCERKAESEYQVIHSLLLIDATGAPSSSLRSLERPGGSFDLDKL